MKITPLAVLSGVAILGLVAALGLFTAINSKLLSHYDYAANGLVGPSPLLALIPLGIGVLAGIAALVLWGVQQGQRSSS